MDLTQVCILILGAIAISLVAQVDIKRRRWGYIVGAMSQPFWFDAAWQAHQIGIMALSVWYACAWTYGAYEHWRLK